MDINDPTAGDSKSDQKPTARTRTRMTFDLTRYTNIYKKAEKVSIKVVLRT